MPLLFIAIAVVFLLVLPMRQRNRAMQQRSTVQASLVPGAEVMTTSGLYGTVAPSATTPSTSRSRPGSRSAGPRRRSPEIKTAPATDAGGTAADSEPDARLSALTRSV